MKNNTINKNGFISIEAVIVGCILIAGSILMMGSFRDTNSDIAEKSTTKINESGRIKNEIDNTIEKKYEEKKEEEKTEQEKNNATLIEPDTETYANLKEYQN